MVLSGHQRDGRLGLGSELLSRQREFDRSQQLRGEHPPRLRLLHSLLQPVSIDPRGGRFHLARNISRRASAAVRRTRRRRCGRSPMRTVWRVCRGRPFPARSGVFKELRGNSPPPRRLDGLRAERSAARFRPPGAARSPARRSHDRAPARGRRHREKRIPGCGPIAQRIGIVGACVSCPYLICQKCNPSTNSVIPQYKSSMSLICI